MRRVLWLILALWPTLLAAQQDDKDYLTRLLQDALSSAGRVVQIDGFQGALSSQASLSQLTIADDTGIWLTLRGVRLDWNRAALLRGRVEVAALTADQIILARRPQVASALPATQARSFSLPVLPVAVSIGTISADRVELGPDVLGRAVVLALNGSMQLENGEGAAALTVARVDGADGALTFTGSYANASRRLALDLSLREGAGGIAATMLGIMGQPPLALTLRGNGVIDDFTAAVALSTDGVDRLRGTVKTVTAAAGSALARSFAADLSGDIAPLFAPAYRSFFGSNLHLSASGSRMDDGALELSSFALDAGAIRLSGSLRLNADGLPDSANLSGRIAAAGGAPVLLPLPGARTEVTDASLTLQFDAANGPEWQGSIGLSNLKRSGFSSGLMALQGSGTVTHGAGSELPGLTAGFSFLAAGLGFADPGLAALLGDSLTGEAQVTWQQGADVALPKLALAGDGFGLEAAGTLAASGLDLAVTGTATTRFDDLARLSLLANRPLGGAVTARLEGSAQLLSGAFDLQADLAATDLRLSQPQADRLLAGQSHVTLSAIRDAQGTELRQLSVTAGGGLQLTATGRADPASDALSARLAIADLSRLGPPFGGALTADLDLSGQGIAAPQSIRLNGTAVDLTTGVAVLDRLIEGQSTVALAGRSDGLALDLESLTITASKATISASGRVAPVASSLTVAVTLPDIAALAPGFAGSVDATAQLQLQGLNWQIQATGSGVDLSVGQPLADRLLQGTTQLEVAAQPMEAGIALTAARLANQNLALTGTGQIETGANRFAADVTRLDLAALDLAVGGGLAGQVHLAQGPAGYALAATATGSGLTVGQAQIDRLLAGDSALTLQGSIGSSGGLAIDRATLAGNGLALTTTGTVAGGEITLSAEATLDDLAALAPGWRGNAVASGSYRERAGTRHYEVTGTGSGLGIGQRQVDLLLAGETKVALAASQTSESLVLERFSLTNPQMTASATGDLASGNRQLVLQARLADLGLLAPGLTTALTLKGTLADQGGPYRLDLAAAAGPALTARVSGTTARDFRSVALNLSGQADAGLANGLLSPRTLQGRVGFDLTLNGVASLANLAGTVRSDGLRLATEYPGIGVTGLTGSAVLAGGQARLDLRGQALAGGQVALSGPVGLMAPRTADLTLSLSGVTLRDPQLYDTSLSGSLAIKGPLSGGARISGTIDLGQTEIRVPSTGLGGSSPIPPVRHLAEPADVHATRDRAGLLRSGAGNGTALAGGAAYGLDVTLDAPRRVFIRGRGLDAELGGTVALQGTTAAIVPVGELNLIRGRLDILGKRFTLDEGLARLQGRFVPFIRLVASTVADGITSSIVIEGTAVAPAISFSSIPDLPDEEVLARLLFGKALTTISPFQAAQLAGAVATLAGRGGDGIISRLRQGFGLDDFDLQSDGTGTTALRLGKYISENAYTDVVIGSDGKSEVTLNLDLSSSVTVRGAVGSDGNTGVGVFYEKDY